MTAADADVTGLPSLVDACRTAVRSRNATGLRDVLLLVIDDLELRFPVTCCDEDGEITASVERAKALVALTEALVSGAGDTVSELIEQWTEASRWVEVVLELGEVQNAQPGFVPEDDSPAERVIQTLASGEPSFARGLATLTAVALTGELPVERRAVSVPVLFDRQSMGAAGRLTLTVVPHGPAGLYPHPTEMALFAGDPGFRASLRQAWSDAPASLRGRCITWAVEHDEAPYQQINDGSLGGAFAVGLVEVEREARRFAWARRLFVLDRNSAVSARLGPGGTLEAVSGVDRKLEAAANNEWRVILPEASRPDVEELEAARTRVRYAADVGQAVRLTRRRPSASVVVVALAVVLTLIAGSLVVHGRMSATREQERAALLRKADELRQLGTGRGDNTVHDRAVQAMLLVAASDLARQAGDEELVSTILTEDIVVDGGTLESLRLDIGNLWRLDSTGNRLLASSTSGRLALVEPGTGDEIGLHTELPGREMLNQRLPTAVTMHPNADVIAASMHSPNDDRPRLVYLAAPHQPIEPDGTPMEELGEIPIQGAPFTALAYDQNGRYLLGASPDELRLFWSGGGAPRRTGGCSLPAVSAAVETDSSPTPTHLVIDHVSEDARVIFENGRVVQIGDVWDTLQRTRPSDPCPISEVLPPAEERGIASFAISTADSSTSEDRDPNGELLIATAEPGGHRVELRQTGPEGPSQSRTFTLDEDRAPIEALALRPDGANLAVARHDDGDPTVEVYDIANPTGQPLQEFAGYGSPLAYAGPQQLIATEAEGNIAGILTDEAWVLPGGGAAPSSANLVTTGQSAFALANLQGTTVSVYRLDPDMPAKTLSFPHGTAMTAAGAMGRIIDINNDGHLLAVDLTEGNDPTDRAVTIWNVDTGVEEAVLEPDLPDSDDRNAPISVRFLPGTDAVIVGYLRGDIVRFDPHDDDWHPSVLRDGHPAQAMWGMDVNAERITALTFEEAASDGWHQAAESLSADNGDVQRSWDLTDLGLHLGPSDDQTARAFTLPLTNGDVLLIEESGAVRTLRTDGSISEPEPVDVGVVLTAAETAPDGKVVVAGRNGGVFLSTQGLVRPVGTAVDQTIVSNVGVTSDHRFLIGAGFARGQAHITPLEATDRLAQLCHLAGRDLTHQEWDTYVGSVASYRPLCAEDLRSQDGFLHAIWDLNSVTPSAMLTNPRLEDTEHYATYCEPEVQSTDIVTGSAGSVSWAAATVDLLNDELLAVVCVDGHVRWLLEPQAFGNQTLNPRNLNFTSGRDAAAESVAISMTGVFREDAPSETLIDIVAPTGILTSEWRDRGAITALDDGTFSLTYTAGGLNIHAHLGSVPTSSHWGILDSVPNDYFTSAYTSDNDTEYLVDTRIGPVRRLPLPKPDSCPDLESFPFEDIQGLDISSWGTTATGLRVHGLDPQGRSIDFTPSNDLNVIYVRDGVVIATEYPADPTSIWFDLYTNHPEAPQDTLMPELVAPHEDSSLSRTPQHVENCEYNAPARPPGE